MIAVAGIAQNDRLWLVALMVPAAIVFIAFFLLPLARLFLIGGTGALGWAAYVAAFTEPRYLRSMISTAVSYTHLTLPTKA